MSLEVQNGKAFVHGIRNDGNPITMSGYATLTIEKASINFKSKVEEIQDETGFTTGLIATDAAYELEVTWMPSGATREAAEATVVVLDPLAKVTLSHFKIDIINGDWVNMGDQSIDLSHKQASMKLKLRKYYDATQNASLTTTVTG